MKWPTLASISLLLALPAFASGQTQTIERQVKGKPDTNVNAGIFTTVRQDCTAGPLPAVRLVTPPAHGKVTVKQGRLRATNLNNALAWSFRHSSRFIGRPRISLARTYSRLR